MDIPFEIQVQLHSSKGAMHDFGKIGSTTSTTNFTCYSLGMSKAVYLQHNCCGNFFSWLQTVA